MDNQRTVKKPIRVYFDGCFDCFHFGHVNALRQAREMGDVLTVGVHSDRDITEHKGRPPVCSEAERYRLLRAVEFVDEVVESAPFLPDVEFLENYNCDFGVHGDDQSLNADGGDSYRLLKAVGKYKEFKRTPGISTTDIIKRMLAVHEGNDVEATNQLSESAYHQTPHGCLGFSSSDVHIPENCPMSNLLAKLSSKVQRRDGDRVVYVAGDFDLFTVDHLELLEKARLQGDYLLVGVHSDEVVKTYRGNRFPVLNLLERALTLLAFRCVSDVIIGAPLMMTEELMEHFQIDVVCQERSEFHPGRYLTKFSQDQMNLRKFELIEISVDVYNIPIIDRIKRNKDIYMTIYGSPDANSGFSIQNDVEPKAE